MDVEFAKEIELYKKMYLRLFNAITSAENLIQEKKLLVF